ncbi:MAG: hypothetical protein OEV66_02375 [Spirochaetia bacterium]|nr:hypothetical protein [Spirochaetia bacterium]
MKSELNFNEEPVTEPASLNSGMKKWIKRAGPILILLASFILGFIYFFNFDIVARYFFLKEGYAIDVDKMDIHLSGNFELQRVKYVLQTAKGLENQIKVEYVSGNLSILKILLSNTFALESDFKGVKIPFSSGFVSGGSWKLNSMIQNISKNVQQWSGNVSVSTESAMLQYAVLNSNYVAEIKSGKIRGTVKNGLLQLDTSEVNTDIARIIITGSTTINQPYNVNIQMTITPLEEFGKKYPNEKSMLSAVMQKETSIIVNLSGNLDNLRPQIKNFNLPGM